MTGNGYTHVRSLMRPSPGVIDGLATVQQALDKMRRENVGALIIDRRHEGDEYGIIVLSDIATKVIAENRKPQRSGARQGDRRTQTSRSTRSQLDRDSRARKSGKSRSQHYKKRSSSRGSSRGSRGGRSGGGRGRR